LAGKLGGKVAAATADGFAGNWSNGLALGCARFRLAFRHLPPEADLQA
jgi:hypothetical protein